MKNILLFLILLILSSLYPANSVIAQQKLDSLLALQGKLESEEKNIENLYEIGKEYLLLFNHKEALNYLLMAKERAEKAHFQKGLSNAYRGIGNVYIAQSLYTKALDAYINSLKINEEMKDTAGIARNYNNIGIIYRYQRQFDKALDYFNKSLHLKRILKDTVSFLSTMNNVGITYLSMDSLESAKNIQEEALVLAKKIKKDQNIANITFNLGSAYLQLQKNKDAEKCFLEALDYFKNLKDIDGISSCYGQLGSLYKKEKKYNKAIEYFKRSLELAIDIKSLEINYKAHYSLYSVYTLTKNWEKALEHYIEYGKGKDSLFSIESSNKLIELEKNYEFEKKENLMLAEKKASDERYKAIIASIIAIVLITIFFSIMLLINYKQKSKAYKKLDFLNIELQEKNKQLEEVNNTKDKFFSIMAHDMKNPLSSFRGITSMLSDSYNTFTEKERIEFLAIIKESSKQLYSLLENLLEWSRSQRGLIKVNKTEFDLYPALYQILDLLKINANEKKIELVNEVKNELLVYADLNLFNTIIRNLISNAIKFTNEKGTVIVDAFSSADGITISIADNGVGMSEAKVNNLFKIDVNISTSGTANEKGTGLGLILCKEFMEKQDGKIWVESIEGKGTKFFVCFPKN